MWFSVAMFNYQRVGAIIYDNLYTIYNRYTVYWCSVSHQSHLLPSVALTLLWVEPSTTGAIPLFFRIVGCMSHHIPILAVLLIDYSIGKSRKNYLYAIRTQYTPHYDTWLYNFIFSIVLCFFQSFDITWPYSRPYKTSA